MSTPQGINIHEDDDVAAGEDVGREVQLRDPKTDELLTYGPEAKPIWIRIAGSLSNVHRRALDARQNRLSKRRTITLTAEQVATAVIELTADCVLGWDGFFDAAGTPVPCARAQVITLLTKRSWILDQLVTAQNDHAAFFVRPSPGS